MTSQEIKQKQLIALKKAMGSIKKSIDLIEEDSNCDTIFVQIDSAIGSLKSARKQVFECKVSEIVEHIPSSNRGQLEHTILQLYKLIK